jgi:hypothetical protein
MAASEAPGALLRWWARGLETEPPDYPCGRMYRADKAFSSSDSLKTGCPCPRHWDSSSSCWGFTTQAFGKLGGDR